MGEKYHTPLSDDYLRALGELTANFNAVDFYLRHSICFLLGLPTPLGLLAFRRLHFRALAETVKDIARSQDTKRSASIAAFAESAIKLSNDRNDMLHSVWGKPESRDDFVRFRPHDLRARDTTIDDIRRISERGAQLMGTWISIMTDD